jgi:phosphorylase kinase alpha/beta subunit
MVGRLIEEVYNKASRGDENGQPYWGIVRRAAGLLDKVDVNLSDAAVDILVRQKQIAVGRAYSEDSLIRKPLPLPELLEKIRHFCREDIRDRVLSQEILIYISLLIKSDPNLFKNMLTVRVGYLILLLTSELARSKGVTQDDAYEMLMQLSPYEIYERLRITLEQYESGNEMLRSQESLHLKLGGTTVDWVVLETEEDLETEQAETMDWLRVRQVKGSSGTVVEGFYERVWLVLERCKGLVIGDKLERRNRLESNLILSEMTRGEATFALQVEHLLNKIQAPEYRSANVEALSELAAIVEQNPEFRIEEYVVLDILIGHAVRLAWLKQHSELSDRYDEFKAAAWSEFYRSSPYMVAGAVADAMRYLTQLGEGAMVS